MENKVVWAEKGALKKEIEQAREQLNKAMEKSSDFETCYDLSRKVDELIERYVDLYGREEVQTG